jgi:hypothetical protein
VEGFGRRVMNAQSKRLLTIGLCFIFGIAHAADPISVLAGTWRIVHDRDRVLSINAQDQTALYCEGGDCIEGRYTVDRVVGSTVF